MLGDELRKARETAGLTQEGLADLAGLHRTYISLLERDLRSPTVEVLFRLCAAIGIRPSVLVARFETDEPTRARSRRNRASSRARP
jgi:transcriptional regulator with XRE-family HTH domain